MKKSIADFRAPFTITFKGCGVRSINLDAGQKVKTKVVAQELGPQVMVGNVYGTTEVPVAREVEIPQNLLLFPGMPSTGHSLQDIESTEIMSAILDGSIKVVDSDGDVIYNTHVKATKR